MTDSQTSSTAKTIRDKLRREIKRVRLSPEQVSEIAFRKAAITVLPEQIRAFVRGTLKSHEAPEWHQLLSILSAMPDAPKSSGPSLRYVPITDEMTRELKAELARTGVRISTIVTLKPPKLENLSAMKISAWKTRRIRKAHPDEWEFVISTLRTLPDKR